MNKYGVCTRDQFGDELEDWQCEAIAVAVAQYEPTVKMSELQPGDRFKHKGKRYDPIKDAMTMLDNRFNEDIYSITEAFGERQIRFIYTDKNHSIYRSTVDMDVVKLEDTE